MKGMLTGPVTILNWSFPRADISRELQSKQLALALRDEVLDLEKAGIHAIQVDEPAIREGVSVPNKLSWNRHFILPHPASPAPGRLGHLPHLGSGLFQTHHIRRLRSTPNPLALLLFRFWRHIPLNPTPRR